MLNLSPRHKKMLAFSLVITASLYLGVVLYTGYDNFSDMARRLGWSGWLLILGCSFMNYLLRFLRWNLYLRTFGYRLPLWLNFNIYMSAFALTTTPGKAGETIRSVYLKTHGIPYSRSLAMFFTERFLDVVVITLLAALSLLSFSQYGKFILGATAVPVLVLPLLQNRAVLHKLTSLAAAIRLERLRRLAGHLVALLDSAQVLLRWNRLYPALLLGLLAWSIQGVAFYFIASTLGMEISVATAMSIYAISLLAGAVSFVPGGIGTTEGVMGLLLLRTGASGVFAASIPLISRISTLWFAVLLGLIASSLLGLRKEVALPDEVGLAESDQQ